MNLRNFSMARISGERENQENLGRISNRERAVTIAVVLLGVLMTAIDTTAVVLALPVMMHDLHSNLLGMIWVIMAYLLVLTVFGTQVGKLGDMYGRVKMYNLGFLVFTVGSLLCGFSQSASEIIAFRIIQGVGGALVFSNSGAIIADAIAVDKRGRAYGLTGLGYSIGATLGILAGGAIITFLTWRYIFFINLPIGFSAVVVTYFVLKDRSPHKKKRIDLVGMTSLGTALFAFLYGLTNLTGSGITTLGVVELLGSFALIIGFIFWERYFSSPLLDLKMFRERVFTNSIFASFFQGLATYAVLFLVIMYLQGVRGMSPFDASLLLIPGYLLGGVLGPLGGSASDKRGARVIASIGLALEACGIFVYSILSLNSALWMIIVASVINGAGSSLFYPANNSAVMANSSPEQFGVASGLLRTFSNAGLVCSFALALLIASLSIPREQAFNIFLGTSQLSGSLASAFVSGMHSALLASITLIILALVLSMLRGKEKRTTMQR